VTATGSTNTPRQASARERLLVAADELFYAAGVQTVGVDRIIERAREAKASLYDGAGLAARMDHRDPAISESARDVVKTLLDAALSCGPI
jgi:hypothetical protein